MQVDELGKLDEAMAVGMPGRDEPDKVEEEEVVAEEPWRALEVRRRANWIREMTIRGAG